MVKDKLLKLDIHVRGKIEKIGRERAVRLFKLRMEFNIEGKKLRQSWSV